MRTSEKIRKKMGDAATVGGGGGCCRFAWQVLRGGWFMIPAAFLVMAGAGATYLYGVYSKDIKARLGYDQSTLNLLASMKDLGANVGIPAGLLAEVAPTWVVLLVGSIMNFGGYFLIWLAVVGKIPKPAVWHMCVYICLGANSQNFSNTGALVTCVKNFPEARGMMLGLMKGFVGLSGALFTQLYYAIYGNDSTSMILLIGWLPSVISIVFLTTLRPMKASTHPRVLNVLYQNMYVTVGLAAFLMGLIIAQKQVQFSQTAYIGSAIAVIVLILLPFGIAVREELLVWREKKQPVAAPTDIVIAKESKTLPESPQTDTQKEKEGATEEMPCYSCTNVCNKPSRGEDYSIFQALLSTDMIIMFVAMCCGLGCNLTTMNNLGQIGESLGYKKNTIGISVSLASIWGFFGRVFTGFISETLLLKKKVPRTLFMTIFLLLSAVGQLMIAFPFPNSVYIASLVVGFSHGAQLTLVFTVVSELFGLKYYSTLFNCGQLSAPLGSYVLSVLVVGKLYDREAIKQLGQKSVKRSMTEELTCIGTKCYKISYLILACTNVFAAFVSLILVCRTRKFYSGDIYKKFRGETEKNENEKEKEMAVTAGTRKQQEVAATD